MMRKLATLALVLSLVALVGFRATHHPVYGNCHQTADGQVCKLIKWEGNK